MEDGLVLKCQMEAVGTEAEARPHAPDFLPGHMTTAAMTVETEDTMLVTVPGVVAAGDMFEIMHLWNCSMEWNLIK